MKKKLNLRNILIRFTLKILTLLAIILLILISLVYRNSRESAREYVSSLAVSMDESIHLIDSTLKTVRGYLSVFEPLVMQYTDPEHYSIEDLSYIYETVHMTVAYSDVIQDMAVVSRDGKIQSFFNNFALGYVSRIMHDGRYDFASTSLNDSGYFFLPDYATAHDPMFIYLFPLIKTDARQPSQRVGTVVLACRISVLQSILSLDMSLPLNCQLLSESGECITSFTNIEPTADQDLLVVDIPATAMPLTIRIMMPNRYNRPVSALVLYCLAALVAFAIIASIFYSYSIHISFMSPIQRMVRGLENIPNNTESRELEKVGITELDIITTGINRMLVQLKDAADKAVLMNTQLLETKLRNKEAELYALQSQVNPHFLFNTLQCIRSLAILHKATDISAISSDMSSILRYSIREMHDVSLREEMAIIRQYLNITDIRYQNRFRYEISMPEEVLQCACPCMIIQPLVENAIIHGLAATSSKNGFLRIHGRLSDNTIHIEISDNGAGIDEEKLKEMQSHLRLKLFDALETHSQYGKSFGLLNIQRRIQLQYGDEYGLTVTTQSGWTILSLHFPAEPFIK